MPFILVLNKRTIYCATLALIAAIEQCLSLGRRYFLWFPEAMFLLNSRCSFLPSSFFHFSFSFIFRFFTIDAFILI